MSKKAKTIGLLAGILLILVIAYASLLIYNAQKQKEEEAAAEEKENGILISEMEKDKITGFSYQINDADYSADVFTFQKKGDNWKYKADEAFPVSHSMVDAKLTILSKVYAKRVLEQKTGDLSKYGLDAPRLTVSATDGNQLVTYLIGDYNANSQTYYLKIKDRDEIYTVDGTLWLAFSLDLYDMAQVEEVPEIQTDHITHVQIKNAEDTVDFTFRREGTETDEKSQKVTITGTWYIEDGNGTLVKANASKTQLLMNILSGFEYNREVNYNCSEEELASYGLDQPVAELTIDYTIDEVDMKSVEQVELEDNLNEIHYETNSVEKQYRLLIGGSSSSYTYEDDCFAISNLSKAVVTVEATNVELLEGLRTADYIAAE